MTISGNGSNRQDSRGKDVTIGMIGDITSFRTNSFHDAPADDALGDLRLRCAARDVEVESDG